MASPMKITSLTLIRTHLSMQDLGRLLELTPALKRLDYNIQFE